MLITRINPSTIPLATKEGPRLKEEKQHTMKVMQLAKGHFLSRYNEGRFRDSISRVINYIKYTVHRFNHGLGHGLRQGALAKDIFEMIHAMKAKYQNLDSPELEELAAWASNQKDPNFLYKIEMASSFQRSGRQSEASSSTDIEKYKRYERQDAVNFRRAALASSYFQDPKEIKIFEEAILWSNKGELDENKHPDLKFLRRILHAAHSFDLRRIPSFDPVRVRNDAMEQLLGKSVTTSHSTQLQQFLWDQSGEYLKETGDRDVMGRHHLEDKFFLQSANPRLLVDAIYKVRARTLPPLKHAIKTLPPSPKGFFGCIALKNKQKEHLNKLKTLANQGAWKHLQTHTAHPHSGFDWWMFPINRASARYGDGYNIGLNDIVVLKNDPEFMKNYREGVNLIAKSWGWDLENNRNVTNKTQYWTDYQVRLGKMLHSLTLFGQKDLHSRLVGFINQQEIRPSLEPWIQEHLKPILI